MGTLLTSRQSLELNEKLKRAEETIQHLDAEISTFLKEEPDRGYSTDKHRAADEFVHFHNNRAIPPRFSIMSGEIVHHLRSCLDHISWMLSSDSYRQSNETAIAFPIFINRPSNGKERDGYERKVGGITFKAARELIEKVQPYNGPTPADHPLAIVHELDRVDKHHNVVLVIGTFDMSMTFPLPRSFLIGALSQMDEGTFADYVGQKAEVKLHRQVSFAEYGHKKNQPVISSLLRLTGEIGKIVRQFQEL